MALFPSLLYSLFLLLFSPAAAATTTTTTMPLSLFHSNPSPDPYKNLIHVATQSLTRAYHLKNPQNAAASAAAAPLSTHGYGGYSVPLSFGTPPQTLQFVMDTGSDIVWFPCTRRYLCKKCSFRGADPSHSPLFIPKLSSSARILGCLNPKCGWIHNSNSTQCRDCNPGSKTCTQICPPYMILYGSGSTGGFGLVDTLDLPGKRVPDFVVGCSVFSTRQPAGIAGFGRGRVSLPSQLGLKKFSFCLLSRKFDDTAESTALVLDGESDSGHKTRNVSYTPFVKNPNVAGKEAFSVYYYVGLRKITVGGKHVKIPYEHLSLGADGNGGTIVDSGSTFTYMTRKVFDLVESQFVGLVKDYQRAKEVETEIGLRPCFNMSGTGTVALPEIRLHFKGGQEMALPLENYFVLAGRSGAVCLAVVTDGVAGPASSGGPAVILGSFQMQNFNVEYDLRNERFGFRRQICK